MIDVNQYAYRQGMGTIDALRIYRKILQENTTRGRHQLTVALDLSNSFNSAWLPYISKQLARCRTGKKREDL